VSISTHIANRHLRLYITILFDGILPAVEHIYSVVEFALASDASLIRYRLHQANSWLFMLDGAWMLRQLAGACDKGQWCHP
jgi:hypothetical protein